MVPVLYRIIDSLRLIERATYLLVGGLGGIGRSLAHLLVDLGARHLCFIFRSGDESKHAQKLIQELGNRKIQTNRL